MRMFPLMASAALAFVGLALPASAAVIVLGGGDARECYLAAESKLNPGAGLAVCGRALDEEVLTTRDRAATLVNRGIVRMWGKDEARAIVDFDAALALKPELPEAMVNKAVALVRMDGDRATAISLLDRALAANVSRPEVAFYARGIAHELSGDLTKAFRDYTRAAALKPGWADPSRQLARFTVVRGRA